MKLNAPPRSSPVFQHWDTSCRYCWNWTGLLQHGRLPEDHLPGAPPLLRGCFSPQESGTCSFLNCRCKNSPRLRGQCVGSSVVCNDLMPRESVTMQPKLRSIMTLYQWPSASLLPLSLQSILKSRHFNIFKGNQNYHSNDKLPHRKTFSYDSLKCRSWGYASRLTVY